MANGITNKLIAVQSALKAPKGQYNSFGKYNYRSCEDILEAVKPHLKTNGLALVVKDEIIEIAGRVYVKATAQVLDENGAEISTTAFAREPNEKKGMDDSQVTGSSSSYARKYALNGLFAIDDNKDADTDEEHNQKESGSKTASSKKKAETRQPIQDLPANACTICHKAVSDYIYTDPKTGKSVKYAAEAIIKKSTEKYGSAICYDCMAKKAVRDAQKG